MDPSPRLLDPRHHLSCLREQKEAWAKGEVLWGSGSPEHAGLLLGWGYGYPSLLCGCLGLRACYDLLGWWEWGLGPCLWPHRCHRGVASPL